ncbi:hypothetical protein BC629DRAFT_1592263 [Irpex lacteus]|nr:hypothetical protein BC629DRAFT_1592263 [Irpex lacteus]
MPSSSSESDLHELDTLLSPDISLPSIAYQAKQGVPIILPCPLQGRRIALGSGIETSALTRADEGLDAARPCAFDDRPRQGAHQLEFTGGVSSFRQASSTHTSSSYDHLDIQGSLSVGYSFLGASCQAKYNKDVQDNRDATKVSLKYALRIGRIVSPSHPRLSREALSLLRTSSDAFREKYGDYYLYALTIGASATTFLSTSSSMNLESEMHDIQVKAHVLWMNPTVFHDEETSHSASTTYDATYSGFDTLHQRKRRTTTCAGTGPPGLPEPPGQVPSRHDSKWCPS